MASENGGRDESAGLIDRISELPDEVRESILGYLPIGNAVRTGVLSRKWRYSWTRAPQLNIEFNEYKNEMSRNKCCRLVVGKILLLHVGHIHKFVLRVSWRSRKRDMNAWVQFLSGHGIKDLTLTIHSGYWADPFDVPPSIYQCVELSSLSLGYCNLLNMIAFRAFPKLVKLHLCAVDVYEDILEKIISSCPLEMLSLDSCTFYYKWLNFIPGKITISAPNLRIFDIVCAHRISNCYLKNTPNLMTSSFTMGDIDAVDYLNSNCFDLLGSMPHIESLNFDCPLHKMRDMDNYFNISRDSLKAAIAYLEAMGKVEIKTGITTLSVTTGREADVEVIGAEIGLIGSIVSCCPSLEKLFIKAPPSVRDYAELHLSAQAVWSIVE